MPEPLAEPPAAQSPSHLPSQSTATPPSPVILPDRRRLHPMGEGEGHSRRAGPRLRRRLARRLGADHHRSRSDALRPAVRALPQPRTRVDAGLRHRFLPGPARRGDRLCTASATAPTASPTSSPSASCRRAPYCATSAACCRCPMARSIGCASWCRTTPPTPSRSPQAIAGEPRLQEARDDEPIVAKLLDIGQRLEGLYRHASTHAAGVVIADRPLIELVPLYRDPRARASRHPVQHEMGRGGGAGEIRLSRPENAHRHRDGARICLPAAASPSIPQRFRSTTRRPMSCWRAARRSACSSSKARACATPCAS